MGFVAKEGDAAIKVARKLYPYWVFSQRKLYVFDTASGLYSTDPAVQKGILVRFAPYLHKCKVKKDQAMRDEKTWVDTDADLNKILKAMPVHIDEMIQDEWLAEAENKSVGKLLFLNGTYKMNEGKWYPSSEDGFNARYFFHARINLNFTYDLDNAYIRRRNLARELMEIPGTGHYDKERDERIERKELRDGQTPAP